MGKRKYYFPPKAEKKPITISDDVKEEFIALIGQDVVVDYNFCGELQQWSMKNFSIKDGVIRHNRLPLIMDVFINGAHNPHKGIATHG